ncbi:MAG: putative baseplate assembly protein, partial [Candidatus Methanoperedens sp.]
TWFDHGKPQDTSREPVDIASSPDAKKYEITQIVQTEIRVKVFVNGVDGELYELDCKPGDDSKEWLNHGRPGSSNSLIKLESRPFALVYGDNDSKIFVKGNDGNLWRYDKETGSWDSPGKPVEVGEDIVSVQSNPHGPLIAPEKIKIFIRGSDNHLWELTYQETTSSGTATSATITSGTTPNWIDHKFPSNSELLFSPFAIMDKIGREHVFSASNQHSIIERRIDPNNMIWNEYEDPNETNIVPALSWQYGTKKDWGLLKIIKDKTKNFMDSGKIIFYMPDEIEEKEIAGQKSFWIRAKIESGDYGRTTFTLASETIKESVNSMTVQSKVTEQTLRASKLSIRPPIIKTLKIGYAVGANQYPEKCLTYNNLMYLDQTEVSRITDKFFRPFVQMDEKYLTIYLGFEKCFRGGPARIFFAARELRIEKIKPKMEWFYSIDNGWNELKGYTDFTEGLVRSDILELIGPLDFTGRQMFAESLSWIKGSLLKGKYDEKPLLQGIYPNTTWALQAATIKNEIIGSSDGNPDQVFPTLKTPVLENQNIRVRELLSEEEKQDVIKDLGKEAIEEIKDEKGRVIETWVSWTKVPDFFDSDAKSRHYTLDRATGLVQFGNGPNGMIPPNGDDNIKAFYQTGGGEQGNIGIGELKSLKTSVSGVEKVSNPVASDGGANAATIEQMLEIGPAKISHRTRAVTISDFEWLARKASRKVVKARCIPNTGKISRNESGKVAVIIVPDEKIAQPTPSLELIRKVQAYLEQHCANTISSDIYVSGPSYLEVNVSVDVFVNSIDIASRVEREVKKKLDEFFHPLTGYLEGKGWDFGRNVSESDIYTLLENIDGVDHVKNLNISSMIKSDEEVSWKSDIFLVANGNHKINTIFEKESNLYGSA